MAELTTAAAIRTILGLESTEDALLGTLLDRAEALIRAFCNRPRGWLKANWTQQTEEIDGDGAKIVLTYNPVDTGEDFAISIRDEAVNATSYRLDATRGIVGFKSVGPELIGSIPSRAVFPIQSRRTLPTFDDGFRGVSVTYTGGYAADAIPGDLQEAATAAVAAMYFSAKRGDPALAAEKLGDFEYKMSDRDHGDEDPGGTITSLPPRVRSILRAGGYVRMANGGFC